MILYIKYIWHEDPSVFVYYCWLLLFLFRNAHYFRLINRIFYLMFLIHCILMLMFLEHIYINLCSSCIFCKETGLCSYYKSTYSKFVGSRDFFSKNYLTLYITKINNLQELNVNSPLNSSVAFLYDTYTNRW